MTRQSHSRNLRNIDELLARYLCADLARQRSRGVEPGAWNWHQSASEPAGRGYQTIRRRAVRAPDPALIVNGQWVVRRLAHDCVRVELPKLSSNDQRFLLHAMGQETGNVRLGSEKAIAAVARHVKQASPKWLLRAAMDMAHATKQDWKEWKDSGFI